MDGELLVVVGPSASGKTTLLRCIAGLETVDSGSVSVGGRDVTHASPGDRDVAMVFQEYALFPHLSVADNIAFGLHARGTPAALVEKKVEGAAQTLGLGPILRRRPNELSGGERQRVALARALVREPRLFLLDEPLANLDAELRTATRVRIRALQRELGIAMVLVTHDQMDAMTLGDRIAVLRAGRVEQVGPPLEVYGKPANGFVARFIGTPPMNLLPAKILGIERAPVAGVRPEDVALVPAGDGRLSGVVLAVEPLGDAAVVHVEVEGMHLAAKSRGRAHVAPGENVGLAYADSAVQLFAGFDGAALS